MTDYQALIETCLQEPDGPTPRLVLADYLEEQGDQRCEALRLQALLEEEILALPCAGNKGVLELRLRSLKEHPALLRLMPRLWVRCCPLWRERGSWVRFWDTLPAAWRWYAALVELLNAGLLDVAGNMVHGEAFYRMEQFLDTQSRPRQFSSKPLDSTNAKQDHRQRLQAIVLLGSWRRWQNYRGALHLRLCHLDRPLILLSQTELPTTDTPWAPDWRLHGWLQASVRCAAKHRSPVTAMEAT